MLKKEQPQRRARQLTALNRPSRNAEIEKLKNELVSLVSHELRTPLTSIKGSLGLILGGACGDLKEDLRDLLTIAYTNNDRLIKLINDLLDVSKIEAGQIQMNPQLVDLAQLVERSIQDVAGIAAQREVLIVSLLTQGRLFINADPNQIQRVLINLLSNALKFSPPNERVIVSGEYQDGWVAVSVKDNGRGVRLEDQQRIFEKFQQLAPEDNRQMQGTGLGLSICKAIIEQHNGTIGVDSAPSQGSRFTFSLPGTNATPMDPPQAQSHHKSGEPSEPPVSPPSQFEQPSVPVILMADDDSGLRKVVARIVEHSGHKVETASNGVEAIERIQRLDPDLVILDILMPVLSGFGVVQSLRRHAKTQHIPLLILTTKDLSPVERDALKLGPTIFLTKSLVTVESLTQAIEELLQQTGKQAGYSYETQTGSGKDLQTRNAQAAV